MYPRTPLNGARMFPLFNLIKISPSLNLYGLFCIKGDKDLEIVAKIIKSNFKKC